jgi:hypothetical protein
MIANAAGAMMARSPMPVIVVHEIIGFGRQRLATNGLIWHAQPVGSSNPVVAVASISGHAVFAAACSRTLSNLQA